MAVTGTRSSIDLRISRYRRTRRDQYRKTHRQLLFRECNEAEEEDSAEPSSNVENSKSSLQAYATRRLRQLLAERGSHTSAPRMLVLSESYLCQDPRTGCSLCSSKG